MILQAGGSVGHTGDGASTDEELELRRRLLEHYFSTQVSPDEDDLQKTARSRLPYVKRLMKRHFPSDRGARILDLGCGYGGILVVLAEEGYTALQGVDASPQQVAAARSLGLDCVREGEVLETVRNLESSQYDAIIAFDLLEHFNRGEALEIADHAYRALAPGGKFIIHVPNGEGILGPGVAFGDITHRTVFTRRSIEQLLRVARFKEIVLEEDTPAVHGLVSGGRWLAWKVVRTMVRVAYVAETGDISGKLIVSQNLLAVARR